MIKKICIMVPTYKRIASLQRLIISACAKAKEDILFGFCVNAKDEETKRFLIDNKHGIEYFFTEENTTQPNLPLYWNLLYDAISGDDEVAVSMIGDDMEFITEGWDVKIKTALNQMNGLGVVYGDDDLIAHNTLCVNLFTTPAMVRATEKPFMCPLFHADMIDVVWQLVGEITGGIKYLPDVIIKHHHATATPKDQWDETFKRLAPVQQLYHNDAQRQLAMIYATQCAYNAIKNGVGKWNVL